MLKEVVTGFNENWIHQFDVIYEEVIEENNRKLIFEKNISPNKIIVTRGGRVDNSGIICINNTTDVTYFLKETPNWEKQYVWFTVK